jgi:hypothetical protein
VKTKENHHTTPYLSYKILVAFEELSHSGCGRPKEGKDQGKTKNKKDRSKKYLEVKALGLFMSTRHARKVRKIARDNRQNAGGQKRQNARSEGYKYRNFTH